MANYGPSVQFDVAMDPYKQISLIDKVLQVQQKRPAATPEQSRQRKRMRLHHPKVKVETEDPPTNQTTVKTNHALAFANWIAQEQDNFETILPKLRASTDLDIRRYADYLDGQFKSIAPLVTNVIGKKPSKFALSTANMNQDIPHQTFLLPMQMQNLPMQNLPMQNLPMQNLPMQNLPTIGQTFPATGQTFLSFPPLSYHAYPPFYNHHAYSPYYNHHGYPPFYNHQG
jgi:hypothetical protein